LAISLLSTNNPNGFNPHIYKNIFLFVIKIAKTIIFTLIL